MPCWGRCLSGHALPMVVHTAVTMFADILGRCHILGSVILRCAINPVNRQGKKSIKLRHSYRQMQIKKCGNSAGFKNRTFSALFSNFLMTKQAAPFGTACLLSSVNCTVLSITVLLCCIPADANVGRERQGMPSLRSSIPRLRYLQTSSVGCHILGSVIRRIHRPRYGAALHLYYRVDYTRSGRR